MCGPAEIAVFRIEGGGRVRRGEVVDVGGVVVGADFYGAWILERELVDPKA